MENPVSHTWADEPEGGYIVTPSKRDQAIRKVAAFLKANYPCYCDQEGQGLVEPCDELDEACSIVEIVEGILRP